MPARQDWRWLQVAQGQLGRHHHVARRLMLTVLGGLAEFERELIIARTAEGRKRAQAKGVKLTAWQGRYSGRYRPDVQRLTGDELQVGGTPPFRRRGRKRGRKRGRITHR
jgi:Resolvase, N terminal domain